MTVGIPGTQRVVGEQTNEHKKGKKRLVHQPRSRQCQHGEDNQAASSRRTRIGEIRQRGFLPVPRGVPEYVPRRKDDEPHDSVVILAGERCHWAKERGESLDEGMTRQNTTLWRVPDMTAIAVPGRGTGLHSDPGDDAVRSAWSRAEAAAWLSGLTGAWSPDVGPDRTGAQPEDRASTPPG